MPRPGHWLRRLKRRAIYVRDEFRCVYCGAEPGEEKLTVDHLTPRARGGSNADHNLVTACRPCNSAKRSLTLPEWEPDPERQAAIRRQAKRRVVHIVKALRLEELIRERLDDELRRLGVLVGGVPHPLLQGHFPEIDAEFRGRQPGDDEEIPF